MMDRFPEVWLFDFEFATDADLRPLPVCLVARELRTGRVVRQWRDEFGASPPYPTDSSAVFVSYYASAEIGCHLALGWAVPERILDLYSEFRNYTNGLPTVAGNGLLGALAHFGLDGTEVSRKQNMRDLVMGGGPWTPEQRADILAYCQEDVDALAKLLTAMADKIDLPRALLRGRYMAAAAAIERNGVPIDLPTLRQFKLRWEEIQDALIADVDSDYGVFDGRTFKADRWEQYLIKNKIPWPRLASGRLDLSRDAFREAARAHPQVSPMRELRHSLSEMRLNALEVGRDGRNRTLLSAFGSRTGRNQPSNTRSIFGPSVWLRGLIEPSFGHAVAYVDWKQQEFGIAAALSGDEAMLQAYNSGDPYLAFALQAGVSEADAPRQRNQFKACVLGVQYGMAEQLLAERIGQPVFRARELLRLHRQTYSTFWRWSDAMVDRAMSTGQISTVFGWRVNVGPDANPRSLRNFPMQANGAEMMRLAACLATERGVEVCAPVHDAFLMCSPLSRVETDVAAMRAAMAEASRVVLGGFELGTDCEIIRYPDRYADKRGTRMWERVCRLAVPEVVPMLPAGVSFNMHAGVHQGGGGSVVSKL